MIEGKPIVESDPIKRWEQIIRHMEIGGCDGYVDQCGFTGSIEDLKEDLRKLKEKQSQDNLFLF